MLKLFKRHPQLGLLGVAGAKLLPKDCIWWNAKEKYGKVYHYLADNKNIWLSDFSDGRKMNKEYEYVEVVDGIMMMTQYDILWRDDIFKGWHYYDISQCMEFGRAGYEVGVPNMEIPWCIHDAHMNMPGYEEYQKKFLEEYKS